MYICINIYILYTCIYMYIYIYKICENCLISKGDIL